ncbi:MAG: T9SS type A sorting domain-containing protein [Bacteroidota bacterium]
MKKIRTSIPVLLLLVILICPEIKAQPWSPLKFREKFNFNTNGLNFITNTIWTDSVKITGGDSVFYLNRIVVNCDTCPAMFRWSNQPGFLKSRMIRKPGGIYNFRTPGSVVINTLAHTGDTWLYDTLANITAHVVSAGVQPVFGVTDSIKEIQLSAGGAIRLSKNFGLLQFPQPATGGSPALLEGIEGRNLGQQVPKFREIYNFNPGDIFQYSGKSMSYAAPGGGGSGYLEKIKILGKDSSSGYYSYPILRYYCSWPLSVQGIPGDTTHLYSYDTLAFQDSVANLANFYPDQLVENPINPSMCGPNTNYFHVTNDVNQLYTKWAGSYNFGDDAATYLHGTAWNPPKPWDLLVPGQVMIYMNSFKPTLGNTWFHIMFFEWEEERELVGYIKNGDTTGVIYPDGLLLQGIKQEGRHPAMVIYPNPARDYLQLSPAGILPGASVEIRNSKGQVVMQRPWSSRIGITALIPGAYFIRITDPNQGNTLNGQFIKY